MLDQQKIGERIAALRKEHGLTQEELAERLGVTGQAVSKWENGNAAPELPLFTKLVELLDGSADDLLFREGEEPPRHRIILPKAPPLKKLLEQCKCKNTTEVNLATVTASETNEGRKFVNAENGVFQYDQKTGRLITSKSGVWVQSEKAYELPLRMRFVVKTDNTNIRLRFGEWSVIFNWECKKKELRAYDPILSASFGISDFGKVPENKFVRIEWIIDRNEAELFVEGKRIYAFEYHNPPHCDAKHKIGVCSAYNSTLTVKSIEVTQNNVVEALDLSKMTLLENAHYMENGELVIFTTDDRYAVSSIEKFTLPLKIDLRAKITNANMRLYYHAGCLGLNWECDFNHIICDDVTGGKKFMPFTYGGYIKPGVYHDVSWILHRNYIAVVVDGFVRFYSEDFPYMRAIQKECISDTIRLASCYNSIMTVNRLAVSELE